MNDFVTPSAQALKGNPNLSSNPAPVPSVASSRLDVASDIKDPPHRLGDRRPARQSPPGDQQVPGLRKTCTLNRFADDSVEWQCCQCALANAVLALRCGRCDHAACMRWSDSEIPTR